VATQCQRLHAVRTDVGHVFLDVVRLRVVAGPTNVGGIDPPEHVVLVAQILNGRGATYHGAVQDCIGIVAGPSHHARGHGDRGDAADDNPDKSNDCSNDEGVLLSLGHGRNGERIWMFDMYILLYNLSSCKEDILDLDVRNELGLASIVLFAGISLFLAGRVPCKVAFTPSRMAPTASAKKVKKLGKVVHYYDRIGVAIVELAAPLKVGKTVCFKHGEEEAVQEVMSLQIDHQDVASAKKGQVVGMKVDTPVKEGALVVAA